MREVDGDGGRDLQAGRVLLRVQRAGRLGHPLLDRLQDPADGPVGVLEAQRSAAVTSSSAPSGSVISAARWTSCASVTGSGSVGMARPYPDNVRAMATFGHVNLVAHDWRALAAFYEHVFGCEPVGAERDIAGDWVERTTGVARRAHHAGATCRLPGHGPEGPTLEIFSYAQPSAQSHPTADRLGFAHIAFRVDDVPGTLERLLEAGGQRARRGRARRRGRRVAPRGRLRARPRGQHRRAAALELAEHLRHAALDRAAEGVPDRALLEALDQLGHEALDHEPLAWPSSSPRERR